MDYFLHSFILTPGRHLYRRDNKQKVSVQAQNPEELQVLTVNPEN